MGDISAPIEMIRGLPVVRAPAEIDATSAEQLRAALRTAAAGGHTTVVVDMTCTRFCDSAGLSVLLCAHRRAVAEGGEVRLVIPAGGIVFRVFSLTGLNWLIPWFDSLDEALIQRPPDAVVPLRSRPLARPDRQA